MARSVGRTAVRFALFWLLQATSLLAMVAIVPGIGITTDDLAERVLIGAEATLALGLINFLVRPLLVRLTIRISILTLGLFTVLINGAMLLLTAAVIPRFQIAEPLSALLGAVVLAAVNTALIRAIGVDDDDSFFVDLIERIVARTPARLAAGTARGLVMIEIDGLSQPRMRRAIEQGYVPTVSALLDRGTHRLSRFDCGVPSQTSSCQAGILYGDNADIPAFRWLDKHTGKLWVSNNFRDVAELDRRLSRGHGLLRAGGSSVNNLLSGDAERALFTMSELTEDFGSNITKREEDLYWLFLNPNVFIRAFVLSVADVGLELVQGAAQRLRGVQPRVNRLVKAYPLIRAVVNVLLRDLSMYLVALDVVRGVPAIYTTFVGYDEVAHYAGPDSGDALATLRGFDRRLRRVLRMIETRAPRRYDLVLLSDHGQSAGATFSQRFGKTLGDLVGDLAMPGSQVAYERSPMPNANYTRVLATELMRVQASGMAGRLGTTTLKRSRLTLEQGAPVAAPAPIPAGQAQITVCAGGNLANVYFQSPPGKLALPDIEALHPGLVDRLAQHPGIGFVIAYDERDGELHPIAFGRAGARDLATGAVTGDDPLAPFGEPDLRAGQLRRLAEFASSGDLILNSAVFEDNQVASFEEMVGSHGGIGGQQTDAFILHPTDLAIPATTNACELFPVLDARRGV